MSSPSTPEKAFFTHLNTGVRKRNLAAFYFIAFMTICLASVINMLQPFMLSEFLGLPTSAHGVPTGKLALASELVIIGLVGTYGILSDRMGRRFIYGLGLLIVGVGFAITPLSRSLETLVLTRCIYAIGAAAITSMLAIVLADYVVDKDRGKATGVMGFMNGLGAMFSALLLVKIPSMLTESGYDAITAGWLTYAGLAVMALVSAIVAWTMLSGVRPNRDQANTEKPLSFMEGSRVGVAAAKDPGVALSYAASFVARPDLAIVALFVPLWISRFGQDNLGMSVQEAVA
ncbi:MAG: MFS transporter, partial [Myxococcota bacterium]|nr:MFS transporter [Myxococcota bacterium]